MICWTSFFEIQYTTYAPIILSLADRVSGQLDSYPVISISERYWVKEGNNTLESTKALFFCNGHSIP